MNATPKFKRECTKDWKGMKHISLNCLTNHSHQTPLDLCFTLKNSESQRRNPDRCCWSWLSWRVLGNEGSGRDLVASNCNAHFAKTITQTQSRTGKFCDFIHVLQKHPNWASKQMPNTRVISWLSQGGLTQRMKPRVRTQSKKSLVARTEFWIFTGVCKASMDVLSVIANSLLPIGF